MLTDTYGDIIAIRYPIPTITWKYAPVFFSITC